MKPRWLVSPETKELEKSFTESCICSIAVAVLEERAAFSDGERHGGGLCSRSVVPGPRWSRWKQIIMLPSEVLKLCNSTGHCSSTIAS